MGNILGLEQRFLQRILGLGDDLYSCYILGGANV